MKSEIKNIIYIDGKSYMKVNVVMLPTNKESKLRLDNNNKLSFEQDIKGLYYDGLKHTYQHLYITSDEEIKEGDNVLLNSNKIVIAVDFIGHIGYKEIGGTEFQYFLPIDRKIIATTNTSLKFGEDVPGIIRFKALPQPSQQFIEKYIEEYNKNNIITDVLVECEEYKISKTEWFQEAPYICKYDDVRIKTNPKDNTITIKKVEDSWNRRKHAENIYQFSKFANSIFDTGRALSESDVKQWIKENL